MALTPKLFAFFLLLFLAPTLVLEVEPETPITQRVLFVVDRSGSMHGDHFSRALAGVRDLIEFPTDDLEFAVLAFNDASLRWPGKPEPAGEDGSPAVPPGWARLPSATAPGEAQHWLSELGAGGDTLVMPALHDALSEPRTKFSVVLVTDGLFGRERSSEVHALIEARQRAREIDGLGRAVIAVYGLGPKQEILAEIAQNGRGGYLREDAPAPEEEFIPLPKLQPY